MHLAGGVLAINLIGGCWGCFSVPPICGGGTRSFWSLRIQPTEQNRCLLEVLQQAFEVLAVCGSNQ
jgi:hypothetical protein